MFSGRAYIYSKSLHFNDLAQGKLVIARNTTGRLNYSKLRVFYNIEEE